MSSNKVSLIEIKKALLHDSRFRDSLPSEYKKEITEFLSNPGCPCNIPLFRKILKNCKSQLTQYFVGKEILDEEQEVQKLAENNWQIVNCHISELEDKLRKLPFVRTQVAIARYEEEITAVINLLLGESTNNWSVFNCGVEKIEEKLKLLPVGRKQIAIARYKNDATLVVNDLGIIY